MSDDVQGLIERLRSESEMFPGTDDGYDYVGRTLRMAADTIERLLADRDAQVREAEERAFMAGYRGAVADYANSRQLQGRAKAFAAYLTRQPAAGAHTEEQKP